MSGTTAQDFAEYNRLEILFSLAARRSERAILQLSGNARDSSDPSPAFYCVHSVSGAAGSDYAEVARGFTKVKLYGVQAPPGKFRDPEFGRNLGDLASYYARALVEFQPEGTFFLGGWSSGGVVAIEIARDLLKRGRKVGLLVAIDTVPENIHLDGRPSGLRNAWGTVRNLPGWIKNERMREKAKRALLARLSDWPRPLSKAKRRVQDEAETRKHDIYKHVDISHFDTDHQKFVMAHYDLIMDHRLGEYGGNVVVYEAKVQPLLHPYYGRYVWCKIAPRAEIVPIEGTHGTMVSNQSANAIAADLQTRILKLAKTDSSPRPQADVSDLALRIACERPPPKGGGFGLRLKAGLGRPRGPTRELARPL